MPEPIPPLRQSVRFIRRQGWLIVLVPALAIAAAAVIVHSQHRVYRASMAIVVAQAGGPYLSPLGNQPLSQTMTSILESNVVARTVVQKLHLPVSSSYVLRNLSVQLKPNSSVLDVTFDSSSKTEALRVLSEVGIAFENLARERLGVSTNLKRPGPLLIVANIYDPPHLNARPVSPRPGKTLGFAGGLGFALGLILAFGRQSLDDLLRDPHDAEEWFGAPLVGTLPRGFRARSKLEGDARQPQRVEDALELLSASLRLRSNKVGPALLVTSAVQDEGTTAVVASLGVALARTGEHVICVDTDFRHGNLQRLLDNHHRDGADAERGLVGVLDGKVELDDALREMDVVRPSSNSDVSHGLAGRLTLLPIGASPSEPTPSLSPKRLSELVSELSARASYVLFDSPPLLSSTSALALASAVDGVLVVARQGRTRREGAQAVRAALDELGARNVAVVLTNARV